MQIYKQNQVIKAISNLTNEQLNVLFQLTNTGKPLTDKELQKMQETNEQRQKSIKASQKYLKTLQKEQELNSKTQKLEESLDSYKKPKPEESKEPEELFADLCNPDDPFGFFNKEPDPLDYLIDPKSLDDYDY